MLSLDRLELEDGMSIEPDHRLVFAAAVEPVGGAPPVDEASERAASLRSFRREATTWDCMKITPGDRVLAIGHRDGSVIRGTDEAPLVVVADRDDPRLLLLAFRRTRRVGLAAAFTCLAAAIVALFV